MPTVAIEDYLKQIYLQHQRAPGELVSMGALAEAMSVVPGTATAMVKRLADSELITYEPYAGVKLTERGKQMALNVLRRHRLIETFLVESLGLDWSHVHEEAEKLEHAVSDTLLDRIDAMLNYPAVDPHGDPIPDASGNVRTAPAKRLTDCKPITTVRIARVMDQRSEFLQFVDQHGLRPGTSVTITANDPAADALTLKLPTGEKVTMGRTAAARIMVE